MSKFINIPINVPNSIITSFSNSLLEFKKDSSVTSLKIPVQISLTLTKEAILLNINNEIDLKIAGTYFKIITNTIHDLINPFSLSLKLSGVGFRVWLSKDILCFFLGFSHDIFLKIPKDIEVKVLDDLNFELKGFSRQKISSFAKFLTTLRKKDAYKGKGIHLSTSTISLKPGKRK